MANISAIKLPNGTTYSVKDTISGYIATETDPVFSASAAAGITSTDINNWNAKVSDDKTWNGVTLNLNGGITGGSLYVPARANKTDTTAYQLSAKTEPTAQALAMYGNNAHLYSTTPSANDNSTKVATTAYVDGAVGGISVPTKTSDLTNDSGFITSYTDEKVKQVSETTNANALPLLFSRNTSNMTITEDVGKHSDCYIKPYYGLLHIAKIHTKSLYISTDVDFLPGSNNHIEITQLEPTLNDKYRITLQSKSGTIALTSDVPTKTSDLTNDSGFVTTDTNTTYTLSNALSSHKFTSTLTAGGSGSGTSTATMEFVAGTGITLTDDTTNKKITIASSVVNTDEKLKVTTISATGSQNFFVLSGNSDNSENKKRSTSALSYYLTSDNKSILAMGASNIMGQIQLIYGDSGGHKVTIQPSSTTGGGDKTITFPDATGTLALTSDIPPIPLIPTDLSDLNNDLNVSDFPNDAGYITGYTETDPVFTASAAYGISASDIINWNNKQAALVSGTNIKTINNTSILGSGNLMVGGTQAQIIRWTEVAGE